jgi:peptide/nickel transport system substrate-binding protein
VLTRYANYWGSKPFFPEVDISIQPSVATQELQLQKGQLDMITHGLPSQDLASLASNSALSVHEYPALLKSLLFINPHNGAFTSQQARDALEQALDKAALTKQVFGDAGTPSTQIYPAGELPASSSTSVVAYDPSVLKGLVPSLPTKTVDIGYDSTDPRNQQMAEFVQLALQNVGLTASTRAIPIAQIFSLSTHLDQAPAIVIQTTNPDAAHPDTWARIYMSSTGGANLLQRQSAGGQRTRRGPGRHDSRSGRRSVRRGRQCDRRERLLHRRRRRAGHHRDPQGARRSLSRALDAVGFQPRQGHRVATCRN